MMKQKMLLITGERRSGTTLLANFLSVQHNFTIYPDFLHITAVARSLGVNSLDHPLGKAQADLALNVFHEHCAMLSKRFNFTSPILTFGTLREFYLGILSCISKPGDLIVGHKSTAAYPMMKTLLNEIPDLFVIYIRRDPRDVVASAFKRRMGNALIFDLIKSWRDSSSKLSECLNDDSLKSRFLYVKYEDLIFNSEREVGRIANFLGVGQLVVPQQLSEYGRPWDGWSSFESNLKCFDPRPVGHWANFNLAAGRIAELLLSDLMEEAGYMISQKASEDEVAFAKELYNHFMKNSC